MIEISTVFERDRELIASKALLDDPDSVAKTMGLPGRCSLRPELFTRGVHPHWGVLTTANGEAFIMTDRRFDLVNYGFSFIPSKVVDYKLERYGGTVRAVDLGGGRFCEAARGLAERFGVEVTSIDIAARNFRAGNLRSIQGDVYDTGLEDRSVDLVYSSQVLPFFKDAPGYDRRMRTLVEVERILDYGGVGVVDLCHLEPGLKFSKSGFARVIKERLMDIDADVSFGENPSSNSLTSGKMIYVKIFKRPVDGELVKVCRDFGEMN